MNEISFLQQTQAALQSLEMVRQLAGKAPASLKLEMMEALESLSTALAQLQPAEEAAPCRTSEVAAVTTKQKQIETAWQRTVKRLEMLHDLNQAILAVQSPEAIAGAALDHVRQLIPFHRASVVTFNLETQEATVLAARGAGQTRLGKGMHLPLAAFGPLEELRLGRVQVIDDIVSLSQQSSADRTLLEEGVRAYAIIPLIAQHDLIGALNLGLDRPGPFDPEQVDIALEVAGELAVAIQQARLLEQVRRYTIQLEHRVGEQEDRLRYNADLLEHVSDAIISSDKDYNIRSWNRAAEITYGYPAVKVVGQPVRDVLKTEYVGQSAEAVHATFLENGFWKGEVIQKHKDGTSIYIQSSVASLRDNAGRIIGAVAVNRDVTGRRQAEEAYRTLVEHSLQGLAILQDFHFVFANSALVQITGYTADELKSMSTDEIRAMVYPKDLSTVWTRAEDRLAGKPAPARYKFRLIRKNGEIRWVEINANRIEYQGRPAIQVAAIDITRRIRAEEALRESEALHQVILSNMSDAVFITDESGAFVYICPNVENIFGYSFEEVQALGHIRSLLGDTLVDYEELETVGEIENIERKITDKSGQKHVLLVNVKYTSIKGGTMLYTCRDITEHKWAKRALQESEAFNRAVLSSLTAHIAVVANDGTIIAVNEAWERFAHENGADSDVRTGVGADYLAVCRQAVGEDADIARAVLAGIQAVLGGSESRFSLEYPCHSPTEKRWFLLHVTPLMNGQRGAVVSHTNITERKQTEDEKAKLLEAVSAQSRQLRTLSARLAEAQEAERKQLARELHDQVGQNLTAVGLNLSVIRQAIGDALPQSDRITVHVDDSLALVEEITDRIRDVMANLRPPMLDDYGLVAALDWYGARFSKWADLIVKVQGEEPIPRLATAIENGLFRIAQEALTNVARHAQASQVVVRVEADNGVVRLVIADDGIGFELAGPAELAGRQSWGLLSMAERAEAVGGYCRVVSRPGQGTQVIVEVSR